MMVYEHGIKAQVSVLAAIIGFSVLIYAYLLTRHKVLNLPSTVSILFLSFFLRSSLFLIAVMRYACLNFLSAEHSKFVFFLVQDLLGVMDVVFYLTVFDMIFILIYLGIPNRVKNGL
jgi:hypothetical protein